MTPQEYDLLKNNTQFLALDKIKFTYQYTLSQDFLDTFKIINSSEWLSQSVIYTFSYEIFGNKVHEEVIETTIIPDGLWSYLIDCLYNWMTTDWRVKILSGKRLSWIGRRVSRIRSKTKKLEIRTEVKHYHICPHLKDLPNSEHARYIYLHISKNIELTYREKEVLEKIASASLDLTSDPLISQYSDNLEVIDRNLYSVMGKILHYSREYKSLRENSR